MIPFEPESECLRVHLNEAEPDVALSDVLVRFAKERGRRNA